MTCSVPSRMPSPRGLLPSTCLWASRESFCGRLVTPKVDGFSILHTQPAFSFQSMQKMCQELGLQHSQEDSIHGCMCGSGVEGNRIGMEQRIEKNILSAMQNLSSFLLPPSSPLPLYFCISTSVQNFRHLRLPGDSIIFVLRMLIEFDK